MGRLELVTGGARSGKSAFAEARASELADALGAGSAVTYVATGTAYDEEMVERIARHRAQRPAAWGTVEAPNDAPGAVRDACTTPGVVLLECLSTWSASRLLALGDPDAPGGVAPAAWRAAADQLEGELVAELDTMIDAALAGPADVIVVTNEVGFGVVPDTPLGRAFRDLLGRLNRHVAARADAVHLVVAGFAVDLAVIGRPTPRRSQP